MVDRGYVVAVGVVVAVDVSTTTGVGAGGSNRPTAATVLPLGFSRTTMFVVTELITFNKTFALQRLHTI